MAAGAPEVAWPWALEVPTRWGDEDRYGHVNNAIAYAVFESAIMGWLGTERVPDAFREALAPLLLDSAPPTDRPAA